MLNNFYTLKEAVSAEIVEKRSKFIVNIFPINDEKDANAKLNEVKKLHRDARHNVFAYRLSSGEERYSDDGEPSGTAGTPIINILRGENLYNVLVVVTRYFGGILLGTGGLAHAYSESTKEALAQSTKKEFILHSQYEIKISYDLLSKIEYYCKTNNIKIINSDFLDIVVLNIVVEKDKEEMFLRDIEEISNRNAGINVVNSSFYV